MVKLDHRVLNGAATHSCSTSPACSYASLGIAHEGVDPPGAIQGGTSRSRGGARAFCPTLTRRTGVRKKMATRGRAPRTAFGEGWFPFKLMKIDPGWTRGNSERGAGADWFWRGPRGRIDFPGHSIFSSVAGGARLQERITTGTFAVLLGGQSAWNRRSVTKSWRGACSPSRACLDSQCPWDQQCGPRAWPGSGCWRISYALALGSAVSPAVARDLARSSPRPSSRRDCGSRVSLEGVQHATVRSRPCGIPVQPRFTLRPAALAPLKVGAGGLWLPP